MDTVLGLLAILAPLVLAAIMIQTRRDAERAIAKLNERVFTLSRRCDVMQDTLDRYHAADMDKERRIARLRVMGGTALADLGFRLPGSDAP